MVGPRQRAGPATTVSSGVPAERSSTRILSQPSGRVKRFTDMETAATKIIRTSLRVTSCVEEVPFAAEHPAQCRELAVEHAEFEVGVGAELSWLCVSGLDALAGWSRYRP